MKEIGGYFGLELPVATGAYHQLTALNTGRNALEYILRAAGCTMVYLPAYTCDAVLEPIRKLGLRYEFYSITRDLDPVPGLVTEPGACVIYNNYFGIKDDTVLRLSREVPGLIVDNSQAFFSAPLPVVDTFYSCRKFFGVADGAYVQSRHAAGGALPVDHSYDRYTHLLKRTDINAQAGYTDYGNAEDALSGCEIMAMSALTEQVLATIDYEYCRQKRQANFMLLHSQLGNLNELSIAMPPTAGPMVYPLLLANTGLRQKLIDNKIFVASYWQDVLERAAPGSFEHYITGNLLPLPIDHRYNDTDMMRIAELILKETGR